MSYKHVLVAVANRPESYQLVEKAVSIVKPQNGCITLITSVADPELYNQMAGMMLENLRDLMQEEIHVFLESLHQHANYPVKNKIITSDDFD